MTDTPASADATATPEPSAAIDRAVAEGGAYEVLHKRLVEQGGRLRTLADGLNRSRLAEFGSSELRAIGRLRVRTENNCVARDLVQVGDCLLFGYNVFIGLKKETRVEDVFALYRLVDTADGHDVEPVELASSFLGIDSFVQDFRELYAYYKHSRLLQLVVHDGLLLASFQIGDKLGDVRVFRWSVSPDGRQIRYVDNRGERDIAAPAAFDFEWTRCGRDDAVQGRHPHLNILDTLFVEAIGGDLTIKVENNTEDGLGIYREPVDDQTQSLDDAAIEYARLGSLILLRVLPYRETAWRYLVFNTLTRKVSRIDAIGLSCVQLPEDHGIVFPGGCYLQNGDCRMFDRSMQGMAFRRAIRSPNGEDVLYVFYAPDSGRYALFTYNLIERKLQPPLFAHGYARYADGRMVVFGLDGEEPTRVHPMQVWQTPFCSDEHAAAQPAGSGFFGRIGNAELVRGVSDLLNLAREIEADEVSLARYERLVHDARRLFDLHHWVTDPHCGELAALLHEVGATGESVLDEFEKVDSIRTQSARAMAEASTRQRALIDSLQPDRWERIQDYVDALNGLTAQRGHLLTIRDYRYIDTAAIDAMETELLAAHERVAEATSAYLGSERALQPFSDRLTAIDADVARADTVAALKALLCELVTMATDLDMLSALMASLRVDDANERTRVVEAISAVYARLNQARARAEQQRGRLGSAEAIAQFGAQFALFGQGVAGALSSASDPERCDAQLARVLVQLEELESQFGEHEQFLDDILAKREEVLEAFESRKQALLDERQRKAQAIHDAALRILDGLGRRTATLGDPDALNAFFAGDALILKLRELANRLRALQDSVKADDLDARLKAVRDQAVRALRDRSELFEGGGDLIRLGRHRFSVNRQELDLTLIPRGDALCLQLTGTDYLEPIVDAELDALRDVWQVTLESESDELYRAEYLAGELLDAARAGREGLTLARLREEIATPTALEKTVRDFAAPRYREGYEKGIHDHDAALLTAALLPLADSAGTLAFEPDARALAWLAWSRRQAEHGRDWPLRARIAQQLAELLGNDDALRALQQEIAASIEHFRGGLAGVLADADAMRAAIYLCRELAAEHPRFSQSAASRDLLQALEKRLRDARAWDGLLSAMRELDDMPAAAWALASGALQSICRDAAQQANVGYAGEAAAVLMLDGRLSMHVSEVTLRADVSGLLGQHARIDDGSLRLGIDDFGARLHRHHARFLPAVKRFHAARHAVLETQRAALRLDEFKAKPLATFVRNKLIDQVYLPLIGDNLAKQIGSAGEAKRSDLMGLLMLISPPGYGKTTLMEYVADRLGLIFMKINGPALGHEVRSLDPAQAPDATAGRELEKLNLALEMGNNVMLYVDDIQHTHPEFLQKFISLCDATRRIEGVWRGRTRTYDMRGKKFCVVMAGNPYTESGELFRIPDMLANRADVYNLGDVLGGMQDVFLLSYIENCLTSNPVLAPLATRDMGDLYRLVDRAAGKEFSANTLKHSYSGAEINEISAVLQRLIDVRDIVFRVNQQYIASAAQADTYRTEPAFKLQGSYRNMNKLAEKLTPVTNATELTQILHDHYLGESQLLTSGAEENLLKLAELTGRMNDEQRARWEAIKAGYQRDKSVGGADADVGTRVVAQLHDLVSGVRALGEREPAADSLASAPWPELIAILERIASEQTMSRAFGRDAATDTAMWLGGLRTALETSFRPLIAALEAQVPSRDDQRAVLQQLGARIDAIVNTPRTDKAP